MESKDWQELGKVWMPKMQELVEASNRIYSTYINLPKINGRVQCLPVETSDDYNGLYAHGGNIFLEVRQSQGDILFSYQDRLLSFKFPNDFMGIATRAKKLESKLPKDFNINLFCPNTSPMNLEAREHWLSVTHVASQDSFQSRLEDYLSFVELAELDQF